MKLNRFIAYDSRPKATTKRKLSMNVDVDASSSS